MDKLFKARCLCGAVKFEAAGPPLWVLRCHCESCRRHTGAPMSVFVAFANNAVTFTEGEMTRFESSPGVERGFCASCGSTLTCSNANLPDETHFHVGAFERAAELAPAGEFFGEERLPWLRLGER